MVGQGETAEMGDRIVTPQFVEAVLVGDGGRMRGFVEARISKANCETMNGRGRRFRHQRHRAAGIHAAHDTRSSRRSTRRPLVKSGSCRYTSECQTRGIQAEAVVRNEQELVQQSRCTGPGDDVAVPQRTPPAPGRGVDWVHCRDNVACCGFRLSIAGLVIAYRPTIIGVVNLAYLLGLLPKWFHRRRTKEEDDHGA